MKKILSFLALLIVAFALPNKASAGLNIYDCNGPKYLAYQGSTDASGNYVFELNLTAGQYFVFSTAGYGDNKWDTVNSGRYSPTGSDVEVPCTNKSFSKVGGDGKSWKVTRTGTYKITANLSTLKMTAELLLPPSELYIYSTSGPTKIGTATNNGSGQYVYTIELTKDQFFVLSTKNNADNNWDTVNSDRYNPSTDTYASTTGGATSFINSTVGAWQVKETGTYEITVDWNTMKLTSTLAPTAPKTLYLVNDGNAGTQTATNDGSNVFTYSVYFHAGDQMYLSTSSAGTAGTNYGPSSDTELVAGNAHSYSKVDSKNWVAPVEGTYDITVDWDNSTFTATWVPKTLYLVNNGNAGTKSATIDGTTFSYSDVYFHAGDQMHLSTDENGAAGTNYGPDAVLDLEDSVGCDYVKTDSNYWVAPVDGTYDITVDWDSSTFTATWVEDVPYDLHLFADGDKKGSAIINGGQFTFPSVELEPGTKLILSTVDNASTGIYTPGSAVTLIDNEWISFSYSDNGYWVAPVKGTYEITVDWNSKKLLATWVEVMPTDMYLFVNGINVASSNSESGDFSYEVHLKKDTQLVLSTDDEGASGTKYTPGAATELEKGVKSNFTNSDSGYWTAPVDGTYTINVSYSNKTLTATWVEDLPTLYLYSDKPSWATKIATLNSTTGTYIAVVKMGAGTNFVLSTKDKTGTDYDGLKNDIYTQGPGETKLESPGVVSTFSNTNNGCWQTTKTGEYTITVTFDESTKTGTLTATWTEPVKKVHMPLSESDFENGKKHYFLVGNRMGEWRLLPEWELKADGNDLVLENRWIYPGGFAIGVVDNYADYTMHKYTYYSKSYTFKEGALSCTDDFSGNGASVTATGTMTDRSNCFTSGFSNGGGDYWQATGTLVTEIRVGLNGSGLPSTLTMKVGEKAHFNKHRFFTLVGNGIYNTNFCNSYGPGTTLQKSKGQTTDNGWQEGWIQYDPVTHEPYVDGNYNYLYHTSYTPDYFKTNPSLFNQTLADGSTFSYTSKEAQFVEYNELSDLDSDPYREFYQVFKGTETIKTGVEVPAGNGYNFKVETVNGDFTPTDNWHCYVVRDMWVSGEFKIWTGWGGNDRKSGGFSPDPGATWHGENAGPDNSTQEVEAYDVTSGGTVKLYRNGKNIDGANYKTPSGDLVYYNRVILWYNVTDGIGEDNSTGGGNTPGVGRSFVQFIQESAGPAIFAQLATNPETAANNYIKYNWYLNKAQNATDSNRKVVGYQIQRYRYVDGVKTFIGYPEGDYVDISKYNVTVAKLQQENAGIYSFTSFTDAGIDGDGGFAPGMYQYDIVVTFEDGTKSAVSNKVAIYDSNIITPSAHALQLVRLNEAGKAALRVTQEYLTYNKAIDGKWFVLDVEKVAEDDGSGNETVLGYKPYNSQLLDGATVSDFLLNNQDKYDWTSNFYIRCLDNKVYTSTFKEYISEGLVKDTEVPTPDVTAFDGYEVTSQAFRFALGEEDFYSAVLMRQGNLEQRTAQVTVSYSYTNANGTDVDEAPTMSTSLMPVTPLPYNPTYSYEIVPYELEVEGDYVEVVAPTRGNASFDVPNSTTSANVAATNSKLTTNLMVLNVKYNRPNVDAEILENYNIEENVSIVDESGDYSEVFWFYYADDKAANVEHIFSAEGVSPYNSSEPSVDFNQTRYLGKWLDEEGNDTRFSDGPAGTFGKGVKFKAPHAIESTAGAGLSGVHLGKIERENGTWDWMYKGHESLKDESPVLVESGAAYENQTKQTIAPNYYLYELSNGNDNMAYDFLVAHSACDHRDGEVVVDKTTGFVLNDEDPLIGTYIAKGFAEETTPGVFVSSIYLFSNPSVCLIDGELPTSNVDSQNTLANKLPSKDEMAAGNVGGMPDYGTEIDNFDYLTGWAVLGQTYSHSPSNNNVTGVEDVLAEGESGEVVYYNLQGIRVDNPKAAGVYVRVQGKDVKKVVIK